MGCEIQGGVGFLVYYLYVMMAIIITLYLQVANNDSQSNFLS